MSIKPTKSINVELPAGLEPTYTNFALISHSPSEIILDLAQMLPNQPQVRVKARVVMTPLNAKLLLRALQENLTKYEAAFGEIVLPGQGDDLAREFFGGVHPPTGEG
ncbi:MAG TPA: DUF3467 domain-containing protein [Anaerolineae bacterium]|nr:DUF3467 domain-containing protein [Anaerolineae bacterium]HQH38968.1 DUF3467 domain-containing protein [Anaerolineae bacterium]